MMYVFSTFVMRGLTRTGPVEAITVMRGINVAANSSPAFLLAYLGAAVLALVVGVVAAVQLQPPGSWWILRAPSLVSSSQSSRSCSMCR